MTDREARLQMRLDMLEDAKKHLEVHKEQYRNCLKWARIDRAGGNYDMAREDMIDAEQHRRMCFVWLEIVKRTRRHLRRLRHEIL